MDDELTNGPSEPEDSSPAGHTHRQIYFVTVEWRDGHHAAEPPERLARAIRHAIEHAHDPGPEAPPARFVVRVKSGELAVEVEGTVQHHHHHG